MYFEDIIKKAARYWVNPIKKGRVGKFYQSNIEDNYLEGDEEIMDWIDVMNWSIAISLTDLEERTDTEFVSVNMLKLLLVEERFKYDLQNQLTNEMFNSYKGFKVIPGSDDKITISYLACIE